MPDDVPPSRLKKYQRAARLFINEGLSFAQMAERESVKEETILGWFEDRDFQRAVEKAREQQGTEIQFAVDSMAPVMVQKLRDIIEDEEGFVANKIAATRLLYPETSYAKQPPQQAAPVIEVYEMFPGADGEVPPPPVVDDDED